MSFRLKTILGIALIQIGLLLPLAVCGLAYLKADNPEGRALFAGLALLDMGLAVLLSLLLGSHLTRQLRWLEQGAKRLAAGEAAPTIAVEGGDELAATGRAFNAMAATIGATRERLRHEHERLQLHRSQLEALIAAKTAELVAARDAAEAASRSKSSFLATMSHEIRTPINAVLGLADLLEGTRLDGEQRDFVEKIAVAGRSLLAVINDVLDFSRIEAGRLELECAPFRLDDLLDGLATLLSLNPRTAKVELVIALAPDLPNDLLGDAARLQQVLINLAGNALKFTEAGEVVIAVEPAAAADGRPFLRFSVRDTGVGIAAEVLPRLFDAFAQADSSTTRRYGGSGLGLAISKRLVEAMGGEMGLDSVFGQGSRFWFTLPLVRAPAAAPPATALPTAAPPLSLLIADDNASARQAMTAAARSLGWRAEAVADGAAAVERLAAGGRYDWLLLDWRMPGTDGVAVARQAAALPQAAGLVVVALAPMLQHDQALQGAKGVVAATLGKPVTAPALRALRQRLAAAPAGTADAGCGLPPAAAEELKGVRVLLVDDNAINQQIARRLLERQGAQVTVVDDGLQAVERLAAAARDYDVVLMDVQMPVMDGYQATRRIKGELRLPLPVIAVTAGVLQKERETALAAGMVDFIGKPFALAEMVRVIRRHLAAALPADPA